MSDLISRQAAIDAIERLVLPQTKGETMAEEINRVAWRCAINCAEEMIGHLPSAEQHGWWINDNHLIKCSICGKPIPLRRIVLHNEVMWEDNNPVKYCPYCGAKMEDTKDE